MMKGWLSVIFILGLSRADILDDLKAKFPDIPESTLKRTLVEVEEGEVVDKWWQQVQNPRPALLVIDMQNDFITGSLAVTGAKDIITPIQGISDDDIWDTIVYSQDWHPKNHISFFSNLDLRELDPEWREKHPGNILLFDEVVFARDPPYTQVLWPDHCVQGSTGAYYSPDLILPEKAKEIKKGINPEVDSYSAFFDNAGAGGSDTGLTDMIRGVTEVVVVGLATDYCVGSTALDAQKIGIPATVLTDATRGVAGPSTESMLKRVEQSGGRVTTWQEWKDNEWLRAEHLARTLLGTSSSSLGPVVALPFLYTTIIIAVLFTS